MKDEKESGALTAIILILQMFAAVMFIGIGAMMASQTISKNKPATPFDIGRTLVAPNVVLLTNKGAGTAFHIKVIDKYYTLTAAHVCAVVATENNEVTVEGKKEKIIGIDSVRDLCLISSSRTHGLNIGNNAQLLDRLVTVGFPLGYAKNIQETRIINIENFKLHGYQYMAGVLYSHTEGGQSGSPVVDENGKVVGMITAKQPYPLDVGFMVQAHDIKNFLTKTLGL